MGDVTVAADAAIAPGVVIKASPGSRIVIASGVCLAGGVCIQSRKGVLTIGADANLGANVLVVGHGTIGPNACISPGSTLMDPQVEAEGLVPPGSLVLAQTASATTSSYNGSSRNGSIKKTDSASGGSFNEKPFNEKASEKKFDGFTSGSYAPSAAVATSNSSQFSYSPPPVSPSSGPSFGQVTVSEQSDSFENTFVEPPPIGPKAIEIPSLNDQNGQYVDPSAQNNGVQLNSGSTGQDFSKGSNHQGSNSSALSVAGDQHVYGKNQVNQLLSTLFPNRVS